MSFQSNVGIILAANGAGNNGQAALPASGANLDSDTVTTPLVVNVGVANRVVLTCAWTFVTVTQYVVSAFINNTNIFNAISGGSATPAFGGAGGKANSNLNQNIPVLSVAQNDTQAGFQALTHTYTSPTVKDYIYLVGNLAGKLIVRITPTGAAAAGDFFICSVDVY